MNRWTEDPTLHGRPCPSRPRGAPARRRRLSPGPGVRNVRILAVALLAVAVTACVTPKDPLRLGRQLAPFERLPYVQAVDSSRATVLWRAEAAASDSFRYRLAGGAEWVRLPVTRGDTVSRPDGSMTADRHVRLEGLPPATTVEYQVFVADSVVGPYRFRTAPTADSASRVRVLAFGDSGWGSRAQVVLASLMERQSWDLAVHTGDIAYDNGTERDFTLRHFNVYRELLSGTPFFVSTGDHDLRTRGGEPYDRAFEWPNPQPGGRYYAFRWGRVQFVSLDTSDETLAGRRLRDGRGDQLPWLRAVLDSAQRDPAVDWTIVYTHAPFYSGATGLGGHGSDIQLRRHVESIFLQYGVDLVLSGHDHHYQRSHPVRGGRRVPPGCGPVYIVTGGGGASRIFRALAPSAWSARSSTHHHYVRLLIEGGDFRGEVIGESGQTLDDFRIWSFTGGDRETELRCRP